MHIPKHSMCVCMKTIVNCVKRICLTFLKVGKLTLQRWTVSWRRWDWHSQAKCFRICKKICQLTVRISVGMDGYYLRALDIYMRRCQLHLFLYVGALWHIQKSFVLNLNSSKYCPFHPRRAKSSLKQWKKTCFNAIHSHLLSLARSFGNPVWVNSGLSFNS